MINQVNFEGYLARSWEHRDQRYMRLANHRPGEYGKNFLEKAGGRNSATHPARWSPSRCVRTSPS